MVNYGQLRASGITKNSFAEFLGEHSMTESFSNMLALDFLIANEDRNVWNLSFLRNSETLEYMGMSPLYDHGASFGYDLFASKPVGFMYSDITKQKVNVDFAGIKNLNLRKISPARAEEELLQLGKELNVEPKRLSAVVASCMTRINTYNISLEKERWHDR